MKRELLVALSALLAMIVFLLWRVFALEDEIGDLRRLVQQHAEANKAAPSVAAQAVPFLPPDTAAAGDDDVQALKELTERNAERLAELEGTVTQIANLLNGMLDEADQKKVAANRRSWSAGQACGPPDTMQGGDLPTAWAPAKQGGKSGSQEWLQLEYGEPMSIGQVIVRETYNPGAISKVSVLLDDGGEVTVWQGTEPTASAPVERPFSAPPGLVGHTVKVYLDTSRVPGWNEIDAVGVVTPDGQRHWAIDASASSSYGDSQMTTYDTLQGEAFQSQPIQLLKRR